MFHLGVQKRRASLPSPSPAGNVRNAGVGEISWRLRQEESGNPAPYSNVILTVKEMWNGGTKKIDLGVATIGQGKSFKEGFVASETASKAIRRQEGPPRR